MESDNNLYIQKEWFITNQGDKKLEDTYDFNIKKVNTIIYHSILEVEAMEMQSKQR